jgi:acyl-CoA reductase-like NAD-dependent aldehyde dehydrogenase
VDPYLRSPDVMDCRDPSTGELLGEVPRMDEDDVVAAIHRARFLQPRWGGLEPSLRLSVLSSVLDRMLDSQDELCRLAAHDSGETMLDAMVHEIIPTARALTALLDRARPSRLPWRTAATPNGRQNTPGILGFFTPGYLPLRNLLVPIAPALLEGSAVVVKVSDRVAWSSMQFAEMVRDVLAEHGQPRELVQLVTGTVESGEALASAGPDRITFVGTAVTSRSVAAAASASLTPVSYGIEVCRPVVIGRTDDPDHALQPAMRRIFAGAGQLHGGAPIVYVHRKHYDRFVQRAADVIQRLEVGTPLSTTTDCGPLINTARIEPLERLLDDAIGKGARLRAGGHRRDDLGGSFFQPTLITDIDGSMAITQERLLGPVMAVHPFEYLDQLPAPHSPPTPHAKEIERAMRAVPLYPARPSTFAFLESAARAAFGRGVRGRASAIASVTRHGLADLRARARDL